MTTTQDWADPVKARERVRVLLDAATRGVWGVAQWSGSPATGDAIGTLIGPQARERDRIQGFAPDDAALLGAVKPIATAHLRSFDATEYARAVREAYISGIITGAGAGQVTANRAWLASATRRDLLAALASRGFSDADAVKIADGVA